MRTFQTSRSGRCNDAALETILTEAKNKLDLQFNVYNGLAGNEITKRIQSNKWSGPFDLQGKLLKGGLYITMDRNRGISWSSGGTFVPIKYTKDGAAYVYIDDVRDGYSREAAK